MLLKIKRIKCLLYFILLLTSFLSGFNANSQTGALVGDVKYPYFENASRTLRLLKGDDPKQKEDNPGRYRGAAKIQDDLVAEIHNLAAVKNMSVATRNRLRNSTTIDELKDMYFSLPQGPDSPLAKDLRSLLRQLMTPNEYADFLEEALARANNSVKIPPPMKAKGLDSGSDYYSGGVRREGGR